MSKKSAIYVRLSVDLKERVDRHAKNIAMPISTAAAELIGLGLEYCSRKGAIDKLEQSINELKEAKRGVDEQARQLEMKLQSVQVDLSTRVRFWEQAYNKVVRDMKAIALISCPYPNCGQSLSAYDLILEKNAHDAVSRSLGIRRLQMLRESEMC